MSQTINNNYVVIMAGGVGTRFWPFSRQSNPKQFHDILNTGQTLLQQTAKRFEGICKPENIYIVTSKEYYEITKQQLPFLEDDQILLEPHRKNTAPCIAYACYKIQKKNPDANIVVTPADHIIEKVDVFREKITIALEATSENNILITLGIQPNRPDTGYGYIKFNNVDDQLKKVEKFTEKPPFEVAKRFVENGEYVWNAGIFIWNCRAIEEAFLNYLPQLAKLFSDIIADYYTPNESNRLNDIYPLCQSISIDNGIMEKAPNVFVVLADIGWSDLGTWKSLYEASEKDIYKNAIDGKILLYDTKNCIIKTPKERLVVINGLDGFIVAEHNDVLMICKKEDEQKVKEFVNHLTKTDNIYI